MNRLSKIFSFARLVVLASLLIAVGHGEAMAGAERTWTLQDSSGHVRLVKSGISPVALTVGDVFSGGDWIETGPDGRAVLMRGEERIVVAPNSRIGLPRENAGPFATRILQTLGTILLTVEKKAAQHFEVQTPYLAAVVKGTTFTVGIQGQRAVVHVVEGLVEVRDLASGQRGLVRPGQTGVVLSDSGSGVKIDGGPADAQGGGQGGEVAAVPSQASTQTAAAAAAASDAGANGQAVAAIAREAGSTGQTVAAAAREAGANGQAVAASRIVIREALGPQRIDLKNTTGGLMREAKAAVRATVPGQAAVKAGIRGNTAVATASKTKVAKLDVGGPAARSGLGGGTALGVGGAVSAGKSGLSGSAGGAAASAAVGAAGGAPGLRRGNGGGSVAAPAATTVIVRSNNPGLAVGPGQSANPGLAVGLGQSANPGKGKGNGK